jgi:ribosomal protein L37AE/L43A
MFEKLKARIKANRERIRANNERLKKLHAQKKEDEEIMFCPDCGTENLARRLKNGNFECEICGYEFDEDESEVEKTTMDEEEEEIPPEFL